MLKYFFEDGCFILNRLKIKDKNKELLQLPPKQTALKNAKENLCRGTNDRNSDLSNIYFFEKSNLTQSKENKLFAACDLYTKSLMPLYLSLNVVPILIHITLISTAPYA